MSKRKEIGLQTSKLRVAKERRNGAVIKRGWVKKERKGEERGAICSRDVEANSKKLLKLKIRLDVRDARNAASTLRSYFFSFLLPVHAFFVRSFSFLSSVPLSFSFFIACF